MSAFRNNTVLVAGATSSLAQALCRSLAQRGCKLVLAGRDAAELELLVADLKTRFKTDSRSVFLDALAPEFDASRFIAQAGDFDHAIIAMGDMGTENRDDMANIAYTAHINYTVPAQIAAATAARLSKGGSLAIISSVAGDRGRQSNYAYGSAKAALTAFASGLRNRYARDGVHVMTVKPGFTDTPMTWGMKSPLIASREYVAEQILSALEKRRNVVYAPGFWRWIMLIIRHIPENIFKRLKL